MYHPWSSLTDGGLYIWSLHGELSYACRMSPPIRLQQGCRLGRWRRRDACRGRALGRSGMAPERQSGDTRPFRSCSLADIGLIVIHVHPSCEISLSDSIPVVGASRQPHVPPNSTLYAAMMKKLIKCLLIDYI